jgi:prevent-host-death family protein
MIKVGLRQANMYFSRYMKMVREGHEIIVTERGSPVAVIRPLSGGEDTGKRVRMLEERGLLRKSLPRAGALPAPVAIAGGPISETLNKMRDER